MKPRDKLKPSKKEGKVCRVCKGCQRRFYIHPTHGKRGRKYCSRKCMLSLTPRTCVDCGMQFVVAKKSKRTVCGSKCPAHSVTYNCVVCNVKVTRPRCLGYGKYCTFECRRADVGDVAELIPSGMPKQINHRRSHLVKDGDLIDKYDVFEFYDWECILCGDTINRDAKWPDPYSPTLEHVIPLGRGGTHTWDNVAPAHLLCNHGKRDEMDEELISKHHEQWTIRQEETWLEAQRLTEDAR